MNDIDALKLCSSLYAHVQSPLFVALTTVTTLSNTYKAIHWVAAEKIGRTVRLSVPSSESEVHRA